MEKIKEWLRDNGSGHGFGSGCGSGCGSGDGCGYGYGSGDGFGSGYGSGSGSGSGCGYGYGDGDGDGYGSGCGSGCGYGYGDGDGDGYGLKSFGGKEIYRVDDVPTIIEHIKDSVARGYILEGDFTLTPCFIVKGHGYFAHGKTLREATEALQDKIFEDMDADEAIEEFMKKFKKGEKYLGSDFFEWHHYLTGSCLMGRELFVRNHDLSLEAMYTVEEFINVCINDYGREIIEQLKERWEEEYE